MRDSWTVWRRRPSRSIAAPIRLRTGEIGTAGDPTVSTSSVREAG